MKKTFDFSKSKEFELKTPKGDTVLREPTPSEYFDYLKKVSVEGQEVEQTYELYIDYFKALGGKEEVIRSLSIQQIFDVAQAINGGDIEKK